MREVDFYYARSGNSLRAAIALELSQIQFRRHELDLSCGDHKKEVFREINPAGHVPVLVLTEGGVRTALPQSGAIMEYLLRNYRSDLWPTNELQRALCNAAVYSALSDIAIQNALARYLSGTPEAAQFVFDRMWMGLLAVFRPLHNTPFLCGNSKTIADYANFPVAYMRAPQLRGDPQATHIVGWIDRMMTDEAIVRAIAYSGLQIKG